MEGDLAGRCLELTRLLVNSGQPFKLNVKVGSLNYFATSGSPEGPTRKKNNVKKKLPATLKRSRRRKEEYVRRKKEATANSGISDHHDGYSFNDLPPGNIPQVEGNLTLGECLEVESREADNPLNSFVPPNPSIRRVKDETGQLVFNCDNCEYTFRIDAYLDKLDPYKHMIYELKEHDEESCQRSIRMQDAVKKMQQLSESFSADHG